MWGTGQSRGDTHSLGKWIKNRNQPWLVWLRGLSTSLWTKGLLVRFPVRARAWVAGQVPSWGCVKGDHTSMFLSLPSPLKINIILKEKEIKGEHGEKWCRSEKTEQGAQEGLNRWLSCLYIKLLALRVLQEESEGLLPYRAVAAVDSLKMCRVQGTCHKFYLPMSSQ